MVRSRDPYPEYVEIPVEIVLCVKFRTCPAEPDVGISRPYADIGEVTIDGGSRDVYWQLPERMQREVQEAVDQRVLEGDY